MSNAITNTCNGWVGCQTSCTPGTKHSTTQITEIIPNTNILSDPGLATSSTIGDNVSGVQFGVAMIPCQGTDCYTDSTSTESQPDTCANGCTGVAANGCVECSCKMSGENIVNVNASVAGDVDANYYNVSSSIYEFPNTINWYGGGSIGVESAYTTLNLPTTPPQWTGRVLSWFVESNYVLAIARVNTNDTITDTQGRTLYAQGTNENIKFGSQVAILCYNNKISRWTYLALSSIGGYQRDGTLANTAFSYDNWLNSWTVWRSLPEGTGNIAQTHPFYGDGVWNMWDPNGATITNLLFQGGKFYLQNWLVSVSTNAGATWADAYGSVPNNLVDLASRNGYMGRYNDALSLAGAGTIYDLFRDEYLLDSLTACLAVQKIIPTFFGYSGAGPKVYPAGSNQQYFGLPLMGVSETLASLANNPAGLTNQTTCIVGEDDALEVEDTAPQCNCDTTQQFYLWYIAAYGGCLVDASVDCPPQTNVSQPLPDTLPYWVPWVLGILSVFILVLLGIVIWLTIRTKNMEIEEANLASDNLGYTTNVENLVN